MNKIMFLWILYTYVQNDCWEPMCETVLMKCLHELDVNLKPFNIYNNFSEVMLDTCFYWFININDFII